MNTKQFYFLIVFTFFLCACSGVEQGTGQVLGNANSAIRSGSDKLWVPREGTPAADEQRGRDQGSESNRY